MGAVYRREVMAGSAGALALGRCPNVRLRKRRRRTSVHHGDDSATRVSCTGRREHDGEYDRIAQAGMRFTQLCEFRGVLATRTALIPDATSTLSDRVGRAAKHARCRLSPDVPTLPSL